MLTMFHLKTEPHTYQVKVGASFEPYRAMFDLPDYVTFTTPNEAKLPLPSPYYLKLHAALCKVGDLSGATDFIEQFYTGVEDLMLEDSIEEDEVLSRALRHF